MVDPACLMRDEILHEMQSLFNGLPRNRSIGEIIAAVQHQELKAQIIAMFSTMAQHSKMICRGEEIFDGHGYAQPPCDVLYALATQASCETPEPHRPVIPPLYGPARLASLGRTIPSVNCPPYPIITTKAETDIHTVLERVPDQRPAKRPRLAPSPIPSEAAPPRLAPPPVPSEAAPPRPDPPPPAPIKPPAAPSEPTTTGELCRKLECSVCLDAAVDTTLKPCGHTGLCGGCAAVLTTCPMCRAPIAKRKRIFLM